MVLLCVLCVKSALSFFQFMTEVAFLFSFRCSLPVYRVVIGEGIREVALEAHCIIFLTFRVVPVQGHPRGGTFRRHEEKDKDNRTGNDEKVSLRFFVHWFSMMYLTS